MNKKINQINDFIGVYAGVKNTTPVIIENFTKILKNNNWAVLGTPGAGMSFDINNKVAIVEPHGKFAQESLNRCQE